MAPSRVAVIGASNDPDKTSGRTVRFLRTYRFPGDVVPVNPQRETVQGLRAYRSVSDIGAPVDLAIIVTPSAQVMGAVADCVQHDVAAVIVVTSGFSEVGGEGRRLESQLRHTIAGSGTRLLGPNCMGLVNVRSRLTATMDTGLDHQGLELHDGGITFLSQSGAIATYLFNVAQVGGVGIGRWISTGNEMDVSYAELLTALVDDRDVTAVLGYIEGVRDGKLFVDALARARERNKPLAFLKAGRSQRGSEAVASHTGAMAGTDDVYRGVFEQFGATVLPSMESAIDWARVIAAGTKVGRRLSITTLSGGAGALAADDCAEFGLELADWSGRWAVRLGSVLPRYVRPSNPIDVAGAIAAPGMLESVLRLADEHPGTDMNLVLVGNMERAEDRLIADLRAVAASTETPLIVVWQGGSGRPAKELTRAGIPTFDDPHRALRTAAGLLQSEAMHRYARTRPPSDGKRKHAAQTLLTEARQAGQHILDEHRSKRLLALYGIPVVDELVALDPEDAAVAAESLTFPVAVKALLDDVTHKSELGLVALGLNSPDEVRRSATRMIRQLPDDLSRGARFVVQRMVPDGLEVILGIKNDPAFGPVIAIGLGGVLAEVLDDIRLRLPPLACRDVPAIISQLRGVRLFDSFRGQPPRDVGTLAEIAANLSTLALEVGDAIAELDINPLVLGAVGAPSRVVDAVVVMGT